MAAVFWTRADGFSVSQAFTSLAIVGLVSTPLANLIGSYPTFVSSVACFGRIQEFLLQDESKAGSCGDVDASERKPSGSTASAPEGADVKLQDMSARQPRARSHIALRFENATVCVNGKSEPILRDISVSIPSGKYTEVTGTVGCGKSTFLKAILGEASLASGRIHFELPGLAVAFCEQSPWLRNISIKDNIVAQEQFDDQWYARVVFACDLRQDISGFPKGDDTLVGSGGITLSGGQKQRVVSLTLIGAREEEV